MSGPEKIGEATEGLVTACAVCGGAGWTPGWYIDEKRPCSCDAGLLVLAEIRKREEAARADEEARLNRARERLRGLPPDSRHPGLAAEKWEDGALIGPPGVGKTRRAKARLLSVPRDEGIFVVSIEYVDIARDVELDRASEFNARRWDAFFERKYLVLDDLGARRPTDFAINAVYRLIDHRWNHQLETLVTSNLSVQEIAEQWDPRIASRILGFGPAVRMDGPDCRAVGSGTAASPKTKRSAFLRVATREPNSICQSEVLSDHEPGKPRDGGVA